MCVMIVGDSYIYIYKKKRAEIITDLIHTFHFGSTEEKMKIINFIDN